MAKTSGGGGIKAIRFSRGERAQIEEAISRVRSGRVPRTFLENQLRLASYDKNLTRDKRASIAAMREVLNRTG